MKRFDNKKHSLSLVILILIASSLITLSCYERDNSENHQKLQNYIVEPTSEGRRLAALKRVEDCDELLSRLKEAAIKDMEEKIDSYIAGIIACGGCCFPYKGYYEDYVGGVPTNVAPSSSAPEEGASDYSTTNNQVTGVDEADFIKNDDSYIYILADNKFQIIDAWPPEDAGTISKVDIEGIPKKLFIASDRALIYSSLDYINNENPSLGYYDSYPSDSECIYGYDCDFTGDNRKLKITIYDISDRSNPALLREIRFSGSYINARRIGTAIHTVVLFPALSSPNIKYWPDLLNHCWDYDKEPPTLEELLLAFDELKQKNREIIDNSEISDWLPGIEDIHYNDGEVIIENGLIEDCGNLYETSRPENRSFLTVLSLDIDELGEIHQSTIFGRPGAVYASHSSLYVAIRQQYDPDYSWYYNTDAQIQQASTIRKFRLKSNPAGSEYVGSGIVKGRVLNQFSMDEYKEHLRIATTTGYLPSPNVHSTLSILREESGELKVIGLVDHVAPKEDIRSVRFNGAQAFIVTFKKTDPLFAFDLGNPLAPKIEGELKIPGYSTYIHLMDEHHLLTIGYDADDQGNFAWFQGIMLQIFDVSVMAAPKLLHKEVIGNRGTTSEAALNHPLLQRQP
jgi:uncharacterized secreted protein with C-terminal beta-propeller domain